MLKDNDKKTRDTDASSEAFNTGADAGWGGQEKRERQLNSCILRREQTLLVGNKYVCQCVISIR